MFRENPCLSMSRPIVTGISSAYKRPWLAKRTPVTTQYINNMGQIAQEGRKLGVTEYIDNSTFDYVGNKIQEFTANAAQRGLSFSAKWEYDYAGRVTKAYNADNGYTTNTYNALGQLVSATDFAGTAITYSYDALNRLLEEKNSY